MLALCLPVVEADRRVVVVTALCWLHPTGEEHGTVMLVGVRMDDGQVLPANTRCARLVPEWRLLPATDINVEVIRS
jgi:hypothetical protein